MIILVVLAAVVVTYRVVLHDRRREIGTMLAVGFPRPWIVSVLVAEAAILLLAGMAAGGLLSLAITRAVSLLSFDWIPGFEIFMQGGRLAARYTAARLAANIGIVLGVVLPVIAVMVVRMVGHEIPSLIKGETT
jgi:putative ABC transport system permease protein